ncbi:hypothetical protein Bbelb_316700 [Branchiostoma belcheri]|nr:hypothetical protein Bbelb_316700 [Branchiostoma belcheri]
MRAQRLRGRQEEYRKLRDQQFQYKTLDEITANLIEAGEIPTSTASSSEEELETSVVIELEEEKQKGEGDHSCVRQYNKEMCRTGVLVCGTHTILGFSSAMNKVMKMLEADMKMEQVLKGFMVDVEFDSKNTSLAGQALDMCLQLVAPEFSHKHWNRYKAAVVLIYIYDHLVEFMRQNPHINNRLACLVREVLELPNLKVVLVVFACLCVHLVEPFYARTIEKGATHSQLSEVYKGLHAGLGKPMSEDFTRFTKPEYSVVSDALFAGVKNSYTNEVLSSVSDVDEEHMTEVKKLTNLMLPHMQTVLARQRRDMGLMRRPYR